MLQLTGITALPFGAFAAAVWAIVAIRRLLRSAGFRHFTKNQRLGVWFIALLAFVPSLTIAFVGSIALINVTVSPGPWVGLQMALTAALGLGVLGAAITWGTALLAATIIRTLSRGREGAA
jgi:hypothetical protein